MIEVVNKANVTEISVIGAIGSRFFDEDKEGTTLNSIESFMGVLNSCGTPIEMKIASLGGDLGEALAIYDMLKAHPHRVVANFIAPTGSAAHVIGMGADYIKCSANALQLGHRSMAQVMGNADDARKVAETLDTYDNQLVQIYKKRSGKSEGDVYNWLKQNKWITPEEAKNFGLINEIYKPSKVLNSAEIEELSKIHELPENFKQPEMENNDSLKQSILNLVGFKNDAAIKAENETLKSEIETLKTQITNSADSATLPLKQEIETLKGEVTNKVSAYDSLKAEYDALKITNEANEAEIARLKAGEVIVNSADPLNPVNETVETPEKKSKFLPQNEALRNLVQNLTSK